MSFGIKIDGLGDLIDELERMQDGLKPEQIDFWCKRISNDVRLKAPDQSKDLVMEVVTDEQGNPSIKLSYLPKLKDLLIQTVKGYLDQMPTTTKAIFEKLIETIEDHGAHGEVPNV